MTMAFLPPAICLFLFSSFALPAAIARPARQYTTDLFVDLLSDAPLLESLLPHANSSSIASLLEDNGLPVGLLPDSVKDYELSTDGSFRVSLSTSCYAKFDYDVYYAQTITGKLKYGTISDLSGIQAKQAFIWVSVTGIRVDVPANNYIYFDVGPISKRLPITQFEEVPTCRQKAKLDCDRNNVIREFADRNAIFSGLPGFHEFKLRGSLYCSVLF